jgi:hypothetical protein
MKISILVVVAALVMSASSCGPEYNCTKKQAGQTRHRSGSVERCEKHGFDNGYHWYKKP